MTFRPVVWYASDSYMTRKHLFLRSVSSFLLFVLFNFSIPGVASDSKPQIVASRTISLEYRYPVESVSRVFKDNILLNLAYMRGVVSKKKDINWDEVKKPFEYQFTLKPSETFAYHEDVTRDYKANVVKTTHAHFNAQEGFLTDGYLYGDGVCHLASLLYWVAKDAGNYAYAPANHDFMAIPEIPREFGVSIYSNPMSKIVGQNMYITNTKAYPVVFGFKYDGEYLTISVEEKTDVGEYRI